MDSLLILLPVALAFFGLASALFLWAVNHQQFDDLDREGCRILFDTDRNQERD